LLVSLNRASWRPRAVRVMSWGVLGIGLLLFAQRAFFPWCERTARPICCGRAPLESSLSQSAAIGRGRVERFERRGVVA